MLALMYGLIIVHLSLYPYSGWRHIGIGPWEYLTGPWIPVHQSVLWGDIAVNILAYIPLGFLLVLGIAELPARTERLIAPLLALCLSFGLEAVQTWLPTRVPSKMDVLTNFSGAIIGAALASVLLARQSLAYKLNQTLNRWLMHRAWLGIGLICLWLVSLLPPRQPNFVIGLWLGNVTDLSYLIRDGSLLGLPDWAIFAAEAWVPSLSGYCFLTAALLIGLTQIRPEGPRARLIMVLLLLSLLTSHAHSFVQTGFSYGMAQVWRSLTDHWLLLFLSLILAWSATILRLKQKWLAGLAILLLAAGWGITLLLPGVYPSELHSGGYGFTRAFRDLQQAGLWVGVLWPVLSLLILSSMLWSKGEIGR